MRKLEKSSSLSSSHGQPIINQFADADLGNEDDLIEYLKKNLPKTLSPEDLEEYKLHTDRVEYLRSLHIPPTPDNIARLVEQEEREDEFIRYVTRKKWRSENNLPDAAPPPSRPLLTLSSSNPSYQTSIKSTATTSGSNSTELNSQLSPPARTNHSVFANILRSFRR